MLRPWLILSACLSLAACEGRAPETVALPGRLTVNADSGGPLLDAPARALVCARDTTAAVVAVGDQWAGAVSMRVQLSDSQPHEAELLTIQSSLDRHRAAMVALRAVGDSLYAWVADSGVVSVERGDSVLSGSFSVRARRDSLTIHLTGAFSVPVAAQQCP